MLGVRYGSCLYVSVMARGADSTPRCAVTLGCELSPPSFEAVARQTRRKRVPTPYRHVAADVPFVPVDAGGRRQHGHRRRYAQEIARPGGGRCAGPDPGDEDRGEHARRVGRRAAVGARTTTTNSLGRREYRVVGQGLRAVLAGAGGGGGPRGGPAPHGAVPPAGAHAGQDRRGRRAGDGAPPGRGRRPPPPGAGRRCEHRIATPERPPRQPHRRPHAAHQPTTCPDAPARSVLRGAERAARPARRRAATARSSPRRTPTASCRPGSSLSASSPPGSRH